MGRKFGLGNLVLQIGRQIYHRKSRGSNSCSDSSSDTFVESPTFLAASVKSSTAKFTTANLTRHLNPPPPPIPWGTRMFKITSKRENAAFASQCVPCISVSLYS